MGSQLLLGGPEVAEDTRPLAPTPLPSGRALRDLQREDLLGGSCRSASFLLSDLGLLGSEHSVPPTVVIARRYSFVI